MDTLPIKKRYLCCLVPLLVGTWCTPSGCKKDTKEPNDIVVYMVRHAEREPTGQNPALTAAGQQRAGRLADALEHAAVSAIYVNDVLRVQLTAAPIAQRQGLTPKVMPVGASPKAYAQAVADDIRSHQSGGRVLVVGQVNTLPLIMQALGVTAAPTLTDADYDNFFIVVLKNNGEATLTKATYGQQ